MYGVLIILFGFLQVADGFVTYLGLSFAGVDEVNPVLNFFAELWGLGFSITLLKLAGLAFITLMFFDRHRMNSRWLMATLISADTFYGWVVCNNILLVASS